MPESLFYLILAACSFLENVFPPFPGDTILVFGAYLSGRTLLDWHSVYWSTVIGNILSNSLIYYLGKRYGRGIITRHPRIFHPELIPRVKSYYSRWGIGTIFISRFLVGMRTVVPLFAGISRYGFRKFLGPMIVSILVQHALLVYLGHSLGLKWEQIKTVLSEINIWLAVAAAVLGVLIYLWFRKKHKINERDGENLNE